MTTLTPPPKALRFPAHNGSQPIGGDALLSLAGRAFFAEFARLLSSSRS